jgi:16S rRNA processing protein RimM
VEIGTIVRPHGVGGALLLAAPASACEALHRGLEIVLEAPAADQDDFQTRIERVSRHRTGAVIQVEHITDRDAAAQHAGRRVVITRDALPRPSDREYYACDIIGASVYSSDGERLGTVAEIIPTGANDVWVVRDGTRELLVPAVSHAIVAIDLPSRRVTVDAAAAQAADSDSGKQ